MPIASLKVSGDKPGGSVLVKNICWHTATKKRYLQAQPLPWSRPQHIRSTGDPASPLIDWTRGRHFIHGQPVRGLTTTLQKET